MPKAQPQFTIYVTGGFGSINKIEAITCAHESTDRGVVVTYKVKGQRKEREHVSGNRYVVILDGWGHVEPDPLLVRIDQFTEKSRYMSFDPRWRADFDQKLAAYLATSKNVKVLADYRPQKAD